MFCTAILDSVYYVIYVKIFIVLYITSDLFTFLDLKIKTTVSGLNVKRFSRRAVVK